jgi:transposase
LDVLPLLDERQKRVVAGSAARMLGRGGQARVTEASGMSRNTVLGGQRDLREGVDPVAGVRRPGGGRKPMEVVLPGLLEKLEALVAPESRGDPMSALCWTAKSTETLAAELGVQGFRVSADTVGKLLKKLGYSLQAPAKMLEGRQHPDRDGQFKYLNGLVVAFGVSGDPVISVDTKKKELVGDYDNGGVEYQPKGAPQEVKVHDFPDPEVPKAVPYGVYDVAADEGWVSVGNSADTAAFAVASIRSWWATMGAERYPNAKRLLICADSGGSNSSRSRLWKVELGRLAVELGVEVTVCHLPPGTSKWNKIEHRLFSFITKNWRGRPLESYRTVVELIAATTTRSGLKVKAELHDTVYPKGIKVTDDQLDATGIQPHEWHGEWNYNINPNRSN